MNEHVGVAVIIVTYHSRDILPDCIKSLGAALVGVDSWALVIVDNASTDGTPDVARDLTPDATVVERSTNDGYAAGVNAGVAAAPEADAYLVLNPDMRLEAGCVQALQQMLQRPGTGGAVPRIVDGDGGPSPSLRREPTVLRALGEALLGGTRAGRIPALGEVVVDPSIYDMETTADWATGACLLISRECMAAIGPWDESFFLYGEETDFLLRARDAGFALRYTPRAHAAHLGGESHVSPYLWSILTVNRVKLYRRRHGRVAGMLFFAAVVLNEALRTLTGSPTHRQALRALLFPSQRPDAVR